MPEPSKSALEQSERKMKTAMSMWLQSVEVEGNCVKLKTADWNSTALAREIAKWWHEAKLDEWSNAHATELIACKAIERFEHETDKLLWEHAPENETEARHD